MVDDQDNKISYRDYIKDKIESILREISTLREDVSKDVLLTREAAKEALSASNFAAEKALASIDRRLEEVNGFRSQMADQQRTYIPRKEVEIMFKNLCARIDEIEKSISKAIGSKGGMGEGIGYVIGVIGVVSAVIAIISRWLNVRNT